MISTHAARRGARSVAQPHAAAQCGTCANQCQPRYTCIDRPYKAIGNGLRLLVAHLSYLLCYLAILANFSRIARLSSFILFTRDTCYASGRLRDLPGTYSYGLLNNKATNTTGSRTTSESN